MRNFSLSQGAQNLRNWGSDLEQIKKLWGSILPRSKKPEAPILTSFLSKVLSSNWHGSSRFQVDPFADNSIISDLNKWVQSQWCQNIILIICTYLPWCPWSSHISTSVLTVWINVLGFLLGPDKNLHKIFEEWRLYFSAQNNVYIF